jgi:hypothetical protein
MLYSGCKQAVNPHKEAAMEPRYPKVRVKLTGTDGNAFALLGKVKEAMRKAKVPPGEITAFIEEATSGDYNHLLQTCMKWVDVA